MSDNKKWFKVWASILTDPKFLNMPLEDIGRWTLLGAMICQQGTNGKLQVLPPSEVLVLRFKSTTFSGLKDVLKMLPNVHLTECFPANDGFIVTLLNWYKYQVDSTTAERVTRLRRKRRGEETSTTTATSTPPASRPSAVRRPVVQQETAGEEVDYEAIEQKAKNQTWKKSEPVVVKNYEEAGDNELCGPPKDLWKQVQAKIKRPATD